MHKIRAEITKGEAVRYISHLDYASAIERAVRRAKLPAAHSEGFNPHMKLAFASALAVGITSAAEYMDIEFEEPVSILDFCRRLHETLPKGIALRQAQAILGKQPALMAIVDLAQYEIGVPFAGDFSAVQQAVAAYNATPELFYLRKTPKASKEVEVKQYMDEPVRVELDGAQLRFFMAIRITPSGSIKPGEIMKVLTGRFEMPIDEAAAAIHRSALYAQGKKPIEG